MERVRAGHGGAVREEELHDGQRHACGSEVEGSGAPPPAAGVEVSAVGDEEFQQGSVVKDGPSGLLSRWSIYGGRGGAVVLHEGSAFDVSRVDGPSVVEEDLVHVRRGTGETSCVTNIFLYYCPSVKKEGDGCNLVCIDGVVKHLM